MVFVKWQASQLCTTEWLDIVSALELRLNKLENQVDFLNLHPKKLDMRKIAAAVAHYYEIPISLMLSEVRVMEIARPRQISMYLCRHLLNSNYAAIARYFRRDSNAVQHACKVIVIACKEDPCIADIIESLTEELQNIQK